jgi:uncharacterized protein (TIGR03435 family)
MPLVFLPARPRTGISAEAYAQTSGRPEFEAASIRPSPPRGDGPVRVFCNGHPGTPDPGLFTCQNMSLSNLVTIAYHVDYHRLSMPDWMNALLMFNVSARIPPNTTGEQFEAMLQNLLTERFKMSVHHENREVTQFSLVVARNGPPLLPHRRGLTKMASRCSRPDAQVHGS